MFPPGQSVSASSSRHSRDHTEARCRVIQKLGGKQSWVTTAPGRLNKQHQEKVTSPSFQEKQVFYQIFMIEQFSKSRGHDTHNKEPLQNYHPPTQSLINIYIFISDTMATAPALCCPNVILDWLLTMAGVARMWGVWSALASLLASHTRMWVTVAPVITDQVLADTLSLVIISDQ